MKALWKKILSALALTAVFCTCTGTALAADPQAAFGSGMQPQSSPVLTVDYVELSRSGSDLSISFKCSTNFTVYKLGVISYVLYDKTAGTSVKHVVNAVSLNSKAYSKSFKVTNVQSGHQYYAVVSFSAVPSSGNTVTKTATTNSVTAA